MNPKASSAISIRLRKVGWNWKKSAKAITGTNAYHKGFRDFFNRMVNFVSFRNVNGADLFHVETNLAWVNDRRLEGWGREVIV